LLDRDRRRNSANVLDPRFVHALEELSHVRTEGFDVTALPFGVDCVESERRFSASTRAGDNGQLSKRKIEIDAFEVILACTADFDATALSRRADAVFFPIPRTHRRQSFHAMRSANFSGKYGRSPAAQGGIAAPPTRVRRIVSPRQDLNRPARFLRCFSNSSGTTPPNDSKNLA